MTSYFELTELHILPALKAVAWEALGPLTASRSRRGNNVPFPHRRPTVRTPGVAVAMPVGLHRHHPRLPLLVTPEHSPSWVARSSRARQLADAACPVWHDDPVRAWLCPTGVIPRDREWQDPTARHAGHCDVADAGASGYRMPAG